MNISEDAFFKDVLLETKDGDWGHAEPAKGLLPYHVIRATDFASTSLGDVGNVPLRYLPDHTVQRRTLQLNDILIETAGGSPTRPTGRTMLMTQRVMDAFDGAITCASFARFLRVDPQKVDPRYLYWFLQALYQSGEIEQYQVQHTGVARFQYTQFAATRKVPLPDEFAQRAVAEVLGALDDKIAANTKMIQSAEKLLQASYRGLIDAVPSTYVGVESLIHRITPKRKFAKGELVAHGDFPVFDQSEDGLLGYLNGEGFLDASDENPILYFGDHTCKLRLATEKFSVGPNTIPFNGLGIPSLTLYCALNGLQNHEEYKRHWQLLLKKEVEIPDSRQATNFASRHRHLLNVIRNAGRENTCLSATRGALLPRLMSGKLRVKDAEKVLAAAGV